MQTGEIILDKISKECTIRENLKSIPFIHYFSNDFMEHNTMYFCIENFMEYVGITDITTLQEIDQGHFDMIVKETTNFDNWNEMLNCAGNEYYQINMQKGFVN
ncbi:hypothetical protein M5C72_06425 [Companilactobacillus allii]|uniref:Uncharacterized protein n=1 Tax=Companilactobacillus allii TaxID=1847728 RepID=A0A1P8Q4H7_9LACO|nr:hypothetical protein [Companilactobacillus allii]APX72737.1 hypothetical protein BTM29_09325 [Companilactobacillus allii]USQ67523.1 hypothetical protein M5C72_06425 [Companilactobacillus allii]